MHVTFCLEILLQVQLRASSLSLSCLWVSSTVVIRMYESRDEGSLGTEEDNMNNLKPTYYS